MRAVSRQPGGAVRRFVWRRYNIPVMLSKLREALVGAALALVSGTALLAASPASGTPFELERTWTWTYSSLRGNRPALELADLDRDGREDVVMLGAPYYYLPYENYGYWFVLGEENGALQQKWSSLGSEVELLGVKYVPGSPDTLVVWSTSSAEVFDAATRVHLRSLPLPSNDIQDIVVADVDGQPGEELVACDPSDLFVLDYRTGALRTTRYGFGGYQLAVGQTDTDPALEIAVRGNPLGGFLLDGATWSVDWGLLAGFGSDVRLADPDGDGLDDVLISDYDAPFVEARDPRSDTVLWHRDGIGLFGPAVGDLGADGLGVVGYSESSQSLVAISALDGSDLWSAPIEEPSGPEIAVGNLDGDPQPEIVVASFGDPTLQVVDSVSHQVETVQREITGPFPGLALVDLDGNGSPEIATTCQRKLDFQARWSPLIFDRRSRAVEYAGDPVTAPLGFVVASAALQIDDDPQLELCVASQQSPGGDMTCLDGVTHQTDFGPVYLDGGPLAMAAGDVDGQGRDRLFVATAADTLTAYGGDPFGALWTSPSYPLSNRRAVLRVGQVDDDPALDLVVAGLGYSNGQIVVLSAETGTLEWGPFEVGASAVDLSPAAEGLPQTVWVGTFGGAVAPLDLATGQLAPPVATFPGEVESLRVVDLTGDGVSDLVVGSDGRISVFGGAERAELWTSPFLDHHAAENDSIFVADEGGEPELLVNLGIGFAVFRVPGATIFEDGFENGDADRWSGERP